MGLLKHLLFWPVTGPTFLTRFSIEKLSDTVREELTSDAPVKEDLLALQMRLELGEIDEERYRQEEAELMSRLRDVRHWREEFGMGMSGGPVRVGRDDLAERETDAGAEEAPSERIARPDGASVEIHFDTE